MKDLMLDIETLGTGSLPVITQIGACYFDRTTGKIGDVFLMNIDIDDSLRQGFTADGGAISWWLTERNNITFLSDARPVQDVLYRFSDFAQKAKTIWSHATFDFPIVTNAMKHIGVVPKFHYTAARDIRTLQDLAGGGKVKTSSKKTHDALDDCKHQVEYCTEYFKKICC